MLQMLTDKGIFKMRDLYTVGVDFGTLSGRSILVRVRDGKIMAEDSLEYPHGVITGGLPEDWALQDPHDYLLVLSETIPKILKISEVESKDVIGISVDATSCTMIPVDALGTPLSFAAKYKDRPHAWCKLWKHHAAQYEADRMIATAARRGEEFLGRFGGKISSEWMLPKIMQIMDEDPELYEEIDAFLDANDWITSYLTKQEATEEINCNPKSDTDPGIVVNACSAGYKAQWTRDGGYLSRDYLKALDPRLENISDTKLRYPVVSLGSRAGTIGEAGAKLTGLRPGTAVAVGNVDAHVAVPGAGINRPGEMLMIIGTSTCIMVCSNEERNIKGICGCVKDGILPEMYGYEAGQPCVGDCLGWFTDNLVTEKYAIEARKAGKTIHELFTEKASELRVGESGLLVIDWWNGNRSILNNADLTGMIMGLTLRTKPEEIYRALIESTAFGARKIRDSFASGGIEANNVYACGGITRKNTLLMQIYADVMNKEIKVSQVLQTPALGAAMYAAVAAGVENGGYKDIFEAVDAMSDRNYEVYSPNNYNVIAYEKLYHLYGKAHDFFGSDSPEIMKELKNRSGGNEHEI